jgi:hypothetical protein
VWNNLRAFWRIPEIRWMILKFICLKLITRAAMIPLIIVLMPFHLFFVCMVYLEGKYSDYLDAFNRSRFNYVIKMERNVKNQLDSIHSVMSPAEIGTRLRGEEYHEPKTLNKED